MENVYLALACSYHNRLGALSPIRQIELDILFEIIRQIPIIVPDDAKTLKDAIQVGFSSQKILVRKGEHVVGASAESNRDGGNSAGATILNIQRSVHIQGEEGVVLRGMLRMMASSRGGSITCVTIHDSGAEACVKAEGGSWQLHNCFLLSGHAAALRAEGDARVQAVDCRFGGEGAIGRAVPEFYELPRTWIDTAGSVQEYGLCKHSCYGIFVRDAAQVQAKNCEVSFCSESGVFVRDNGQVWLRQARVVDCVTALTAGLGLGQAVEAEGCVVERCRHVWFDADRPRSLVWTACVIAPPCGLA